MSKIALLHSEHGKGIRYILGAAIVILLVFSLAMSGEMQSPEFCGRCHVIKPYYLTWENSPHSNVSCLSCHVEPGTGYVSVLMQRLREFFVYVSGDVTLPIKGRKEISSETCLNCHSPNRRITPSGDLTIPHTEHLGYGTGCVDCHPGVAHAGLSAMETFRPDEKTLASFKNTRYEDFALTKTGCLDCHDGNRATYNCEACHTQTRIPENHYYADFGYRHGNAVREDIGDCMRCHTGFGKNRTWEGNTVPEITRNARFCRDCHEGVRPVTHTAFWSVGHKIPGKSDPTGCLVCHDWDEPAPPLRKANVITCAACHEQTPEGHDDPRWYWDHKEMVKEKGSFSCFDCHGATSCFTCHTRENVGFGR